MALRAGHGNGAGVPRIEVLPADELPAGIAGPEPHLRALPRPPYAAGSAEAREAGRRGGKKRAQTTALAAGLGIDKTPPEAGWAPYRRAAENFAKLHIDTLARTVGGGTCGPGPSSMVQSAAWQLAASRYAFEVTGDHALGSRLANDSRQNLLAAHELCAKEASRPKESVLARLRRECGGDP